MHELRSIQSNLALYIMLIHSCDMADILDIIRATIAFGLMQIKCLDMTSIISAGLSYQLSN